MRFSAWFADRCFRLPYNQIFGGVSALSRDQFQEVNGFSNMYFGWGGEDDDMFHRSVSQSGCCWSARSVGEWEV